MRFPQTKSAVPTILATVGLLLAGCGSGGSGSSSSAAGATQTTATSGGTSAASPSNAGTVTISNYKYEPASLTVTAGTKVVWTNQDTTPHTATADGGSFDTGSIKDHGGTGSVTLTKPGTFTYYCQFHPFMKGTLVVQG